MSVSAMMEVKTCATERKCASKPCKNGGKCIEDFRRRTFKCRCPANYAGAKCQHRK